MKKKSEALKKQPGKFSPRIGKKYQAEIPPYTGKCDYLLQLANRLVASEKNPTISLPNSSSPRPPIPLVCANCEDGNLDEENLHLKKSENVVSSVESNAGSSGKTWTDLEGDSLLLGLYIFKEKNFVLLRRFIGTNKNVGDIQSFYYGNKFYRSEEHLRWRKYKRSKKDDKCTLEEKILCKCTLGKKIFTGWRQDRFMAQLFSLVPKDLHEALIQSFSNFTRRKLSFIDYVFTLRNIVGVSVLVKAVGIGQGKHDLTVHHLASAEIKKLLERDLSKPQLRDLFWKAVWPHLLTAGWHLERVKHHKMLGLKHSLVFLVYGVKKFSKRLVKGHDYFDSVTDVLKKAASQSSILGSSRNRAARVRDKFTVVDTSMLDQAELHPKVERLRNLPGQSTSVDKPSTLSVENVENVSENPEGNAEQCKTSSSEKKISENGTCYDSSNCVASNLDTIEDNGSPKMFPLEDNNHQNSSTSPAMQHLIRRKDCRVENISVERDKMEEECTCQSTSPKTTSAVSSLGKGDCPVESDESIVTGARLDREVISVESPPQKYLFDLNIPPISPDLGTDRDMTQNRDDSCGKGILIDLNIPYVSPDLEIDIDMTRNSHDSCGKGILIDLNTPYVPTDLGMDIGMTENIDDSRGKGILTDLTFPSISPDLGTETGMIANGDYSHEKGILVNLNIPYTDMMQNNGDSDINKSLPPSEGTAQLPKHLKLPINVANEDNQPVLDGQRKCTRSRPMTKRALEGLEHEFFNTRRRKRLKVLHRKTSNI